MARTFEISRLLENLQSAASNLKDIPYEPFAEAMLEFSASFSFLGKAMSMAFSDITTKAETIKVNFRSSNLVGLQSMIMDEVSRGVERVHTKKEASTARTVLRLLWFFDFLVLLLENLAEHTHWKMSKCCKKAYDEALAPHHPWTVRTAAALGIKCVPNRNEYMACMLPGVPQDQQLARFMQIREHSMPIKNALWSFFRQNNLAGLP